jgi:mannose-6-phosphate isomerase-like protein (cupin superfamily)
MTISNTDAKDRLLLEELEKELSEEGISVLKSDLSRPWGGFFVIDAASTEAFLKRFFPDLKNDHDAPLSPKILFVEPGKRLSWQYHDRRSEEWLVVKGRVGVIISDSDKQGEITELESGDRISVGRRQRHRLVGLDGWGVVAEIWKHTDPENPSDEEDIIRLEDDFGR